MIVHTPMSFMSYLISFDWTNLERELSSCRPLRSVKYSSLVLRNDRQGPLLAESRPFLKQDLGEF